MKKNGYRGGATPQEMLAPLAVLTAGDPPPGWREVPADRPAWWEEGPARPAPRKTSAPSWLEGLLTAPLYQAQRGQAGRNAPPDEMVRNLLAALEEHGGAMTEAALARHLELPPSRLAALVAAVRRLLNVEGYPVLARDDLTGGVKFEGEMLRRQFGL